MHSSFLPVYGILWPQEVVVLKPILVKANYSFGITSGCTKSPEKLFCTSRWFPFFPLSLKLRHRVERAWPCTVLHLIMSVCDPPCVNMHAPKGKFGLSNTGGDSLSHDRACDWPYVTLQKSCCQTVRKVAATALIGLFLWINNMSHRYQGSVATTDFICNSRTLAFNVTLINYGTKDEKWCMYSDHSCILISPFTLHWDTRVTSVLRLVV